MSDPSQFAILTIGFTGIATWIVVAPVFDRRRIADVLLRRGATRIAIERRWFAGGRYERAYDVTFTDARGRTRTMTCVTSMLSGVFWRLDAERMDADELPWRTRNR